MIARCYKIRTAQMEKVPYMAVVGEKEAETCSVSVRKREEGDLGRMPMDRLLEMLRGEGAWYTHERIHLQLCFLFQERSLA